MAPKSKRKPKRPIPDREALEIHGYVFSSDSDASFSGKSEFDDEYHANKPPPVPVDPSRSVRIDGNSPQSLNNTVIVRPQTLEEDVNKQKKRNRSRSRSKSGNTNAKNHPMNNNKANQRAINNTGTASQVFTNLSFPQMLPNNNRPVNSIVSANTGTVPKVFTNSSFPQMLPPNNYQRNFVQQPQLAMQHNLPLTPQYFGNNAVNHPPRQIFQWPVMPNSSNMFPRPPLYNANNFNLQNQINNSARPPSLPCPQSFSLSSNASAVLLAGQPLYNTNMPSTTMATSSKGQTPRKINSNQFMYNSPEGNVINSNDSNRTKKTEINLNEGQQNFQQTQDFKAPVHLANPSDKMNSIEHEDDEISMANKTANLPTECNSSVRATCSKKSLVSSRNRNYDNDVPEVVVVSSDQNSDNNRRNESESTDGEIKTEGNDICTVLCRCLCGCFQV